MQDTLHHTVKNKAKGHDVLELGIAYVGDKPRINDVKRISKLSRRLCTGSARYSYCEKRSWNFGSVDTKRNFNRRSSKEGTRRWRNSL
jgi:hypothetical protein